MLNFLINLVSSSSTFTLNNYFERIRKAFGEKQHNRPNKAPRGIILKFPPAKCSAVRKVHDKAAITTAFQYNFLGWVAYLMSFDILSSKVGFIAMRLLVVHVETSDGIQCINLSDGVPCVPGLEMSLRGATSDAISLILGPFISNVITVSVVWKEEVKQTVCATRCVTMRTSKNPDEGAILNLNLALEKLRNKGNAILRYQALGCYLLLCLHFSTFSHEKKGMSILQCAFTAISNFYYYLIGPLIRYIMC